MGHNHARPEKVGTMVEIQGVTQVMWRVTSNTHEGGDKVLQNCMDQCQKCTLHDSSPVRLITPLSDKWW